VRSPLVIGDYPSGSLYQEELGSTVQTFRKFEEAILIAFEQPPGHL
jgi:hypothetical protein